MKHILIGAIAALALGTIGSTAQAAPVGFNGDTTGGPTFSRPVSLIQVAGPPLYNAVRYETIGFTVDAGGSYQFNLDPPVADPFHDVFLVLYSDNFNPVSPLGNILALDDDSSGLSIGGAQLAFDLAPGVDYFAVATGFENIDFGSFALIIDGPGTATRIDRGGAVPEPASWALMLTGFGGMGALVRRRRADLAAVTA